MMRPAFLRKTPPFLRKTPPFRMREKCHPTPEDKLSRQESFRRKRNPEIALIQIKWRELSEDLNASKDLTVAGTVYHESTLKGSVELMRCTSDHKDFKLVVNSVDDEVLDIPLPFGVDWNVSCQSQGFGDIQVEVVQLAFKLRAANKKIKIRIGLPFDGQKGSRRRAKQFCEKILSANLESITAKDHY